MANIKWMSGFETGSRGGLTYGSVNANSVVSEDSRSGSYCLKPSLVNDNDYILIPFTEVVSEIYTKFSFKVGTWGTTIDDDGHLFSVTGLYKTAGFVMQYHKSGIVRVSVSGALVNVDENIGPIFDGKWNTIETYFKAAGGESGELHVKLNGLTAAHAYGGTIPFLPPDSTASQVRIGGLYKWPFYIDDIVIATNGWIGDNGVLGLIPSSDNDVELTPSTGTDNYVLVNDSSDTTYVEGETGRDLYDLSDTGASGSIIAVQWNSKASVVSGTGVIKSVLKLGSTEYDGISQDLTTTPAFYRELFNVQPDDSSPWTAQNVEDLIGGQRVDNP